MERLPAREWALKLTLEIIEGVVGRHIDVQDGVVDGGSGGVGGSCVPCGGKLGLQRLDFFRRGVVRQLVRESVHGRAVSSS
jgi:hypothetical protein